MSILGLSNYQCCHRESIIQSECFGYKTSYIKSQSNRNRREQNQTNIKIPGDRASDRSHCCDVLDEIELPWVSWLWWGLWNGMRYKETACSTLHAVNHIGWGKKQPKGTYATVCQNSSADSGFSGEPSRILPQQSGKTPLHILSATVGSYQNPTDWKQATYVRPPLKD